MPLHYVAPHNEHGRRYKALESFGRSRPGQFLSRGVFFRIDPWLYRATGGRYPRILGTMIQSLLAHGTDTLGLHHQRNLPLVIRSPTRFPMYTEAPGLPPGRVR
jgi:hypothetical protein